MVQEKRKISSGSRYVLVMIRPRARSLAMNLLIMRGLHFKQLAKKYHQTHTERIVVNDQPPLLESEEILLFNFSRRCKIVAGGSAFSCKKYCFC